ncbi:MAG: 23S rRNA (guanosine(2251)-2'-O)-methyltransferase RlmB [Candidatus Eremiobacteraeota bacterium]|nr:23S rRNA (guanosine(2251)-2'-O)-methyltransferase RlmB [Candidatus Eremiobacteraeota bacterium]
MAEADETIVGIHAVTEALAGGEQVKSVTVSAHRQRDPALAALMKLAMDRGVPVKTQPDAWFNRLPYERHQHVAAQVAPFTYADWKQLRAELARKNDALVVVADHIEDPQNLGAVMRAAEGAGAGALVIPDRRSAAVTAAARRAAAGAASHLAVALVPNVVRALEDLKEDGFWVSGLTAGEPSEAYTDVDFRGKSVLVVGSEGKGLGRLVAERCDRRIKIPMRGRVASLNAAAAVAVVLFEALRQRSK